ncbi:MAG: replication-relaxation family protein [Pseudonocardia sp.]
MSITHHTPQRALRSAAPGQATSRCANTADHQARLAWRLTPRDRWIIRMLHEHRVLTSTQITALAFPSYRSGTQRLRELYLWSVIDRFQPFASVGTAPMHYVLATAGAAVLAAEEGLEVKDLGYRHNRAFGVAHNLRLAHLVGVNEWFTALIAATRHDIRADSAGPGRDTAVGAWWSEARCARHFGDLTKPDAYGRFHRDGRHIEFFLEFDQGTEALTKLAGKLTGYAALAAATGITTPLLIWLPTARREASARRQLRRAWQGLDHPDTVPVATAAAGLLDPLAAYPSPADPVWLPLHTSPGATPAGAGARLPLHLLAGAWPHVHPPESAAHASDNRGGADGADGNQPDHGRDAGTRAEQPHRLAPPHPMPPVGSRHAARPRR